MPSVPEPRPDPADPSRHLYILAAYRAADLRDLLYGVPRPTLTLPQWQRLDALLEKAYELVQANVPYEGPPKQFREPEDDDDGR